MNKAQLIELLASIVENARIIPDPAMAGATDCYSVPLEDIDAAKEALEALRDGHIDDCPIWVGGQCRCSAGKDR